VPELILWERLQLVQVPEFRPARPELQAAR